MNKIKSLVFGSIRWIDDLFYTYFGPIRVLFVVQNKFGFSCLLPIILMLEKKSQNVKIAVTLDVEGCIEIPTEGEVKRIFEQYYVAHKKAVWQKWHYVVMSDLSGLYFRRHYTAVLTEHGPAFGNSCKDRVGGNYNLQMALSPSIHLNCLNSITEYLSLVSLKPSLKDAPDKCFFITGLAKTDHLFQSGKTSGEALLKSNGLNIRAKTIVIFSHWTQWSLLNNYGMTLIERLVLSDEPYNIIVNGHENLWFKSDGNAHAPTGLMEQLKKLEQVNPQVKLAIMLDDMGDLFDCADLFITDYSSVFVECCIADKPILFYKNSDFEFIDPQVGANYYKASQVFDEESDILQLSQSALANPFEHEIERKNVVDFFLNRQGCSAEYIVDQLLKIGKVCGPTSFGWKKAKNISREEMQLFDH